MVVLLILSMLFEVAAVGCAALAGRTATRFGVWVNLHVWVLLGVAALVTLVSFFINPSTIGVFSMAGWIGGGAVFRIIFGGLILSLFALDVLGYLVGRYLLSDAVQSRAIRLIDNAFTQSTHSNPPPHQGGAVPPQPQQWQQQQPQQQWYPQPKPQQPPTWPPQPPKRGDGQEN